jgi:hypothetical protein
VRIDFEHSLSLSPRSGSDARLRPPAQTWRGGPFLLVPEDNWVARAACEFRRQSRLHTIPPKNERAKRTFCCIHQARCDRLMILCNLPSSDCHKETDHANSFIQGKLNRPVGSVDDLRGRGFDGESDGCSQECAD